MGLVILIAGMLGGYLGTPVELSVSLVLLGTTVTLWEHGRERKK